MVENGTASFEGVISPTNATNKLITWSSNNTKVATVDSKGNVKAIKAGSAVITVTTKDGVKKVSFGGTVK
ncbi:Ig-like domain-containing protein [Bacillus sp. ISL-7]|uniref:Ig-like domain-containing protein n=1 Tax=Bacillus sp. ISL-7 TaxID=2819136 RepID=UPI001BE5B71D|nr:Ig-like domain-containing protein [Bacillus sp. ISL-7]MBT2738102.1 Ig-like domain-containing protein [Bacillus sp. ISL-7]